MPDKIITKLAVEGETYVLKDQALTDNVANNYYTKTETDNRIGKGSLIIQKNGNDLPVNYGNEETKQSFGANDTDACIVNVQVPTQTSELTNNSGFITNQVNDLANYYDKDTVEQKLSQLETNIDWKEAVNTYNDIATTYPNPQDGWTVNVKDTDYTYRYDGTNWVAISANAIPNATTSVNGLMTTTQVTKLNGIAEGAEVNVQSDWNQSDNTADDYIKNKPAIPTYGNAVSKTGNVVNVLYDNGTWGIGKNQNNQLCINGKFVKQVENLDTYQGAEGEIVEYIGATNDKYTNGHIYKLSVGESVTIPADAQWLTFTNCVSTDNAPLTSPLYNQSTNYATLYGTQTWTDGVLSMPPQVGDYVIRLGIGKLVEILTVEEYGDSYFINLDTDAISLNKNQSCIKHYLYDTNLNKYLTFNINNPNTQYGFYVDDNNEYHEVELQGCVINSGQHDQIILSKFTWTDVYPTSTSELINDAGFITALVNNLTNYYKKEEVDNLIGNGTISVKKNGSTVNSFTTNQKTNTDITLPNDVVMCKMSDGIVYDSYITYTKVKQYLPDYPYYSDNLNWEIGGNPPMRASITEGDYYLDVDTNHIFVADENLDLVDVTSTVVIQGDTNKLYCDIDTNILYRYDGNSFLALTSNFSGDYNDLINKPDLNFLKQRDLTTYQGENDEIVQHVGNNSSGYTNGYVYKKSNVYSITYNGVTYTRVGKTDDDITWKFYKITQDNINYVLPQEVSIGDNFWVVDNFITLRVVHIFEIDNIEENEERTQMDVEGHFLGTNITLHFVAPFSEIINTSKALIYKNGNNYLYCDSSFRLFASSINNNNANVIPFNGTINNDYIWQRINVQPQQLSLESSKVKYTLSDGTTKLTLAQESDLATVATSGSYNDLTDKPQNATTTTAGLMSASDKALVNNLTTFTIMSINISDYYCCLIADITDFWESPSTTVNLACYGFCGLVIRFRNEGNLNSNCANMVAMVSYKNDGADDHQRFISSDSNFVPHIVKYANKYYISLDFGKINAHYLTMIGKFHNCLSPFQIVLQSNCTVIV